MLAHVAGRSTTKVKVLTWKIFTLTLDLQHLTCNFSISCRTFDLCLSIFQYAPALVT